MNNPEEITDILALSRQFNTEAQELNRMINNDSRKLKAELLNT